LLSYRYFFGWWSGLSMHIVVTTGTRVSPMVVDYCLKFYRITRSSHAENLAAVAEASAGDTEVNIPQPSD
jgi:hypothetical protein